MAPEVAGFLVRKAPALEGTRALGEILPAKAVTTASRTRGDLCATSGAKPGHGAVRRRIHAVRKRIELFQQVNSPSQEAVDCRCQTNLG